MPTPSLLIVPARFKTGKLYSQIPTSGAGDFTVTRNTAARRFNSAGLIESVASGIPRLDYYTSGGVTGCPALLVEPAGTNLAFHSETWASGNNWTLDAVTRVTGSTSAFLAPDGSFTANAISPTSANVFHGLYSNSPTQNTYISGTIYTQSAFFKQGTGVAGRYVQLTYTGGGQFTQNGYANFDLQLGTVAVVSGTSADTNRAARIENYGNGWYRCSFTATCNTAGSGVGVLPVLVNASGATRALSFSGTVTDVLYGWGAQLETGSVATSYIPTTTVTGSRSADVISVTGAVSGSIGQQSGTVYCEFQFNPTAQNNNGIFSIESTNNQNRILLANASPTTCNVQLLANNSAIFTTSIGTLTVGQYYKIAVGYSSGNTKVYLNGNSTPVITNTSGYTMAAALSRICLGNYENAAVQATNSRIRSLVLYAERLTDAEMIALTT